MQTPRALFLGKRSGKLGKRRGSHKLCPKYATSKVLGGGGWKNTRLQLEKEKGWHLLAVKLTQAIWRNTSKQREGGWFSKASGRISSGCVRCSGTHYHTQEHFPRVHFIIITMRKDEVAAIGEVREGETVSELQPCKRNEGNGFRKREWW